MKIKVSIKNVSKAAAATTATIDATVGPSDKVQNVQELIASMTNTIAFPDQKLLLSGEELSNSSRLSDFGVKDGDALEFTFQATEQTLIKQLSDLVGNKSVSASELGLLYSYRYAVAFEDVLKVLGHTDAHLKSFIQSQKCFAFDGNCVKLVQASDKAVQSNANLSTIKEDKSHGIIEVSVSVEINVAGRSPELPSCDEDEDTYMCFDAAESVQRTKDRIAASQQISFPDRQLMLDGKALRDDSCLGDAGVKNGSALLMVVHASENSLAAQLEGLLFERKALSANELGLHYCQRFGAPVGHALRCLGLHSNLGRFLKAKPQFMIKGGCVTSMNGPKLTTPSADELSDN